MTDPLVEAVEAAVAQYRAYPVDTRYVDGEWVGDDAEEMLCLVLAAAEPHLRRAWAQDHAGLLEMLARHLAGSEVYGSVDYDAVMRTTFVNGRVSVPVRINPASLAHSVVPAVLAWLTGEATGE